MWVHRQGAVRWLTRIGDIAAESGRTAKGVSVRKALQLQSVEVRRDSGGMYRRSGLVMQREQGMRCAVKLMSRGNGGIFTRGVGEVEPCDGPHSSMRWVALLG